MPQIEADYENDIYEKFPGESANDALNTEKYAADLIKENWLLVTEVLSKIKNAS